LKKSGIILIVGDATTITKSGKETFGLGRFFSSIYSGAVPGIAFQTLSLLNVDRTDASKAKAEKAGNNEK